jgi:hypothetical protein
MLTPYSLSPQIVCMHRDLLAKKRKALRLINFTWAGMHDGIRSYVRVRPKCQRIFFLKANKVTTTSSNARDNHGAVRASTCNLEEQSPRDQGCVLAGSSSV